MIAVLIVDDQALVRAGFRAILETQPALDLVGEAEMDIRMPKLDGIEAATAASTNRQARSPRPDRDRLPGSPRATGVHKSVGLRTCRRDSSCG
jgi:CheY-like chemotaxis protein